MTYSRAHKDEMGVSLRVIFGCGVAAKTSYKALLPVVILTPMLIGIVGIHDLPNELILHIVSYIKNPSTLHNLSLVSITLFSMACLSGVSYGSFLRIPGSPAW